MPLFFLNDSKPNWEIYQSENVLDNIIQLFCFVVGGKAFLRNDPMQIQVLQIYNVHVL